MRFEQTGRDGHWKKVRGTGETVTVSYDKTGVSFTESFGIGPGYLKLKNTATASLPASPDTGALLYDSTTNTLKVYNGSSWDEYVISGSETDSDAIHDNVAGEISAITEKASPVDADLVIIEDSAASNAKKKVQVGNLPVNGAANIALDAGIGVDFSANTGTAATGAATTSELFDWYEEGTWTPNLWDDTLSSSESQTYSLQTGMFTRIGRLVTFHGAFNVTSGGTLTGTDAAKIGPLPYTSVNTANITGSATITEGSFGSLGTAESVVGHISANENYIRLKFWDTSTAPNDFPVSQLASSGKFIYFTGMYTV